MVLFNYSTKELTAKIVYYGPGLCGKTTNLQFIYDNLPSGINKGKMLSLATKTDRTLFFDFLPIDLGTIRGMRTRLQLYTVPGQVFYNTTRKLVLKGADGVVFVADSQKKMLEANVESFGNLEENLAEHGMKLAEMPHILQFNKRDLSGLCGVDELNAALNKYNAPIYEAVATTGIGVHDTLKAVTRLVLNSLKEKYGDSKRPAREAAAVAAAAPPPPAPKQPRRAAAPAIDVLEPAEAERPVVEVEAEVAEEPAVEIEEPVLSVEVEPEPVLEAVPEPPKPSRAAAPRSRPAVEESEEVLDLGVVPEPGAAPSFPEEPALALETSLEESAPVEGVLEPLPEEEPIVPIEVSEPEPLEVETASVDPTGAGTGSAAARFAVTGEAPPFPVSGASAETRAVAFSVEGGGGDGDVSREATFPIVLNLQGRPLHLKLTITVRVEKP